MRRAVPLLMFCLPALAHADCTAQLAGWAKKLHPELAFSQEHSVCKVSPVDPSRTLAALVFVEQEDDDGGSYALEVLSAHAGMVERHVFEAQAITADAIRFAGLSLDTARYNLAPGLRAFGVRINHSGPSRVNPYDSTTLSLYVDQDGQLRKVLDQLEVARSGGEWDGNCAGEFYDTVSSVAIGKAVSHGYASLEVTDKSTTSRSVDRNGECTSQDASTTPVKSVLTFNGRQYDVPERDLSRWSSDQ